MVDSEHHVRGHGKVRSCVFLERMLYSVILLRYGKDRLQYEPRSPEGEPDRRPGLADKSARRPYGQIPRGGSGHPDGAGVGRGAQSLHWRSSS